MRQIEILDGAYDAWHFYDDVANARASYVPNYSTFLYFLFGGD